MTNVEIGEVDRSTTIVDLCNSRWDGQAIARFDRGGEICRVTCRAAGLVRICEWLTEEEGYAFATLVVEESAKPAWLLTYIFYKDGSTPLIELELQLDASEASAPSLVGLAQGPSVDWHEREAEDLFGLRFSGHPRLGEFVLHEDWPEGVNPMRRSFEARRGVKRREPDPSWEPPTIVVAPGSFAMPVGPIFSDFAEASHFLLETVGEDVIHTIPRFFYNYRGVEKLAEQQPVERVLLLAERFSGSAAFAHGLAFCQAVEAVDGIEPPARAKALRVVFAELERLRHHAATITGICNSTALAVATSQAALIEEDLLRLTCEIARHRYLFGVVAPGGLTIDLTEEQSRRLETAATDIARRLSKLHRSLRYSSSFLDRLEQVGILSTDVAISYGLLGPIARASGVDRDLRKLRPYASYDSLHFEVPSEAEGDGYARLRVFFAEAEQSAAMICQVVAALPKGNIRTDTINHRVGAGLAAVEAPSGAAFHWVRLQEDGTVARYRVTPPSFANWHGFHLAAENFAFQDFPIILASFGLSNAECDR